MKGFVTTWSGMANEWECDELGHLNMRFYLTKAQEARQMFVMRLGLPFAFSSGTPSTIRLKDVHIRYMKEARPGAQLRIETGLLEIGTDDMRIVHMMYHGTGELAASLVETLSHVYRRTKAVFPWPKRVFEAAEAYQISYPDIAKTKGLKDQAKQGYNGQDLLDLGLQHVGTGVFVAQEANTLGRISAQTYLGRLSDSIAEFKKGWPEIDMWTIDNPSVLGVMLELRLSVFSDRAPGDPYHIYSAVVGCDDRVRRLNHYFVNPFTGTLYAMVEAVNGLLDMKARKLVKAKAEDIVALKDAMIPALVD